MGTVVDLHECINDINVHRDAKSAIGRTSDEIAQLNTEQLMQGTRADGEEMPWYSQVSVEVFGKPDGPIRLFDTGAFHSSFTIDVGGEETEVLATDLYNLEERYGEEIYGLTDKNQEYYNQEVFFPEFAKSIEGITGLKIQQ